jgi:hypothetical protein
MKLQQCYGIIDIEKTEVPRPRVTFKNGFKPRRPLDAFLNDKSAPQHLSTYLLAAAHSTP